MEVSGRFANVSHKVACKPQKVTEGQEAFHPVPITVGCTICSVMETPNLGRYVASLNGVLPPSKASNNGMYHLEWGISKIV